MKQKKKNLNKPHKNEELISKGKEWLKNEINIVDKKMLIDELKNLLIYIFIFSPCISLFLNFLFLFPSFIVFFLCFLFDFCPVVL